MSLNGFCGRKAQCFLPSVRHRYERKHSRAIQPACDTSAINATLCPPGASKHFEQLIGEEYFFLQYDEVMSFAHQVRKCHKLQVGSLIPSVFFYRNKISEVIRLTRSFLFPFVCQNRHCKSSCSKYCVASPHVKLFLFS